MGVYVNPSNRGFSRIRASEYVDKSGIIALLSQWLDTPLGFVCASRPRRFGKSFAAEALVAYYSRACDSHALFDDLAVAKTPDYERYLNAFNVIHLDMSSFASDGAVAAVTEALLRELHEEFPTSRTTTVLTDAILAAVHESQREFVFVVDEWDAVFREAKENAAAQEAYVRFLRLLFKNGNFTSEAVAAAYLTGILPIKRYGTQSALTDFYEYTMLQPGEFAPFVGFTAPEIESLAAAHGLDVAELRRWYDGYDLPTVGEVYAPFSVMRACKTAVVGPYWTSSETYESLRAYIEMDFQGLQADVVRMIGGDSIPVDPHTFQNDMTSIHSRDDVLTLLIHLGYLAYDEASQTVRIPNEEVRREFVRTTGASSNPRLVQAVCDSRALLQAMVQGDEQAVAAGLQRVHDAETAPLFYNDEQALRATIKTALFAAIDDYARVEELPSGHGFADVAYIPRRATKVPAILVELKWNRPAKGAMDQIREKDYPQMLRELGLPAVLVGVSYDARTKRHECRIERLDSQGNVVE